MLFELIAHRCERFSLMITSNHPFREWDCIFTDTTMTVAAIDRLVNQGYGPDSGQNYHISQKL